MQIALLSCALVGCAYQPGTFANLPKNFSGQRASVGCLDVAVERRADLPIGPVLGFQFANRSDHPAMIDLAAVVVVGRNAQGIDVTLTPYDPRAELHAVALDGRNVGAESLAYPADRTVPQVCVDVATLAHLGTPRWLCFGAAGRAVVGSVP
jgi:hypothetical protein